MDFCLGRPWMQVYFMVINGVVFLLELSCAPLNLRSVTERPNHPHTLCVFSVPLWSVSFLLHSPLSSKFSSSWRSAPLLTPLCFCDARSWDAAAHFQYFNISQLRWWSVIAIRLAQAVGFRRCWWLYLEISINLLQHQPLYPWAALNHKATSHIETSEKNKINNRFLGNNLIYFEFLVWLSHGWSNHPCWHCHNLVLGPQPNVNKKMLKYSWGCTPLPSRLTANALTRQNHSSASFLHCGIDVVSCSSFSFFIIK